MGAFLILGIIIAALLALIVIFGMLADYIPVVKKLYLYLKKKILYNALIRFIL